MTEPNPGLLMESVGEVVLATWRVGSDLGYYWVFFFPLLHSSSSNQRQPLSFSAPFRCLLARTATYVIADIT